MIWYSARVNLINLKGGFFMRKTNVIRWSAAMIAFVLLLSGLAAPCGR